MPENLALVRKWRRQGLTQKEVGKKIGIGETTVTEWKNKFPAFLEAIKKGKEQYDGEVEEALSKTITGFFVDEEITEITVGADGKEVKHIKKVKKYVPPNTTAIIFYLKARGGWRENAQIVDAQIKKLVAEVEKIKVDIDLKTGQSEDVEDFEAIKEMLNES